MVKMQPILTVLAMSLIASTAWSQIELKGTVKDGSGKAIEGAIVSITKSKLKDTTDAKGEFQLVDGISGIQSRNFDVNRSDLNRVSLTINEHKIFFSVNSETKNLSLNIISANGQTVFKTSIDNVYQDNIRIPKLKSGIYLLKMNAGSQQLVQKIMTIGDQLAFSEVESSTHGSSNCVLSLAAADVDTIVATKSGYATKKVPVDSYAKSGIAIVLEEAVAGECKLSVLPEPSALKENKKLPNPFAFFDGRVITKKSEWPCLRKEILNMASKYFYGPMPPFEAPDVKVEGTVAATGVTAKITYNGKSETMNFSTSGSGDILLISMGSGLPPGSSYKFRTLSVSTSTPASWGGVCTKLFGKAPCGELAIAWGCNILCRAIADDADGGIDTNKIMTTGCSNTAKAAFISAAYCEGIDLAVVVESGGWGDASPRVAQYLKRDAKIWQCSDDPQGLWKLDTDASQFLAAPYMDQTAAGWVVGNNSGNVYKLPFDTHMLMACIAPRYFCGLTNGNGPNSWCHLNGTGSAVAAFAAEPVFNALGVPDHFGFDISKTYMHCMEAQQNYGAVVEEFFKRVFKGDKTAKTDVLNIPKANVQLDPAKWKETWIDWDMNKTLE
jgi:hypothetical protein